MGKNMKWFPSVIICLTCLSFLCVSMTGKKVGQLESGYKKHGVKIDGLLNEWDEKDTIILDGAKANSENMVKIRSCWDSKMLYLSFDLKDNDLRAYQDSTDHPKLFLDDMVEFLLDTQNDKDSCWGTDDIVYHINLAGAKKDDRGTANCKTDPSWNGKAAYRVKMYGTLNDTSDVDRGYSVEIGIPWKEIGKTPKSGLVMGINFTNGDNDGKGRQLFDWAGAWPLRSPYAFGNLILKRKETK